MTGRGGGYRYFGAAKSLPGVRELFEKEPPKKVRSRANKGLERLPKKAFLASVRDLHAYVELRACIWPSWQCIGNSNAAGLLAISRPRPLQLTQCQVRRTRKQLYEHIDGDYYGYRDEEDGVLVKVEAAAEAVMQREVRLLIGSELRT